MKRMTQREYKLDCGINCPICRSNNCHSTNTQFLSIEMYCPDCKSEYEEFHKITGYKLIKKGRSK